MHEKKNWLFTGSERAGKRAAAIQSLLYTAKLNGLDPAAWVMARPNQFRPGPPPSLKSEVWARDYNEIKALVAKESKQRTPEQMAIALFWASPMPAISFPIVRSVASANGHDVTHNARLLAAVALALDDAVIAAWDAKFHYGFWRPLTAIRNGDIDGNDATERDPAWLQLIDTPSHPEYPCAHCTLASTLGTLLRAEIGTGTAPTLTSTSVSVPGMKRSWRSIEEFMQEVAEARIYDGVHYRDSTVVGMAMGKKLGELAAEKLLR